MIIADCDWDNGTNRFTWAKKYLGKQATDQAGHETLLPLIRDHQPMTRKRTHWYPIVIEREGKSYQGSYAGDAKAVTVMYGGHTLATAVGTTPRHIVAQQLLSELVRKATGKLGG